MSTLEKSFSNRTSIVKLLTYMREICINNQNKIGFDNIDNRDCENLTGLLCDQFEDICSFVFVNIKSTPSRTPKTSVGLFLMKIKCALSNKLLSTLFNISISSVRRAVHTVRQAFMRSFVPLYLGFESITWEQIIKYHTRPLATTLLGGGDDGLILVLDGTYIYIYSNKQQFHLSKKIVQSS